MLQGRLAIIDPSAGVSGDMLLGSLLAVGCGEPWLRGLPARLGFPDVTVQVEGVKRCGIACTKVTVRLPGGETEGPHDVVHDNDHFHPHETPHHDHSHGHAHGPDHAHPHAQVPHRHVGELIAIVERAPISPWVRERAVQALRLLGQAEGQIHGVPPEEVALHEVGAMDALVDIVGGIEGFEQLGIERIYHRPVAVGSGWIRMAHGAMAVPAPVTALLLEGLEVGPNGPVTGEATTPTGAVLLRVLSAGPPPARWRGITSGWGAGTRDPDHYPNALRLLLVEPVAEAGEVVTLSTDLDDLSPEYLEPLREALFSAGALDVHIWSTQTKKGRIGFRLEVIADTGVVERVTEALFLHSTTAGVRRWTAERVTLPRRQLDIEAAAGVTVRVKVLESPGGPRIKPEYEDITSAARQLGRPAHELAREVQRRALELVAGTVPRGPQTLNQERE